MHFKNKKRFNFYTTTRPKTIFMVTLILDHMICYINDNLTIYLTLKIEWVGLLGSLTPKRRSKRMPTWTSVTYTLNI
jgi:hypothetical protein